MNPALLPLVAIFVEEGHELAATATRAVLALEAGRVAGPDEESPRDVLGRVFHTMKGAAGTLGMTELASLAHAMETALPPRNATKIAPRLADVLLHALDVFSAHLGAALKPSAHLPELGSVMLALAEGARGPAPLAQGPAEEISAQAVAEPARPRRADEVIAVIAQVERLRELRSRLRSSGLRAEEDELADIIDRLEEQLRALGSDAVGRTLEPLQRVVRDLATRLGKEVSLSVVGGELSIDRRVLAGARDAVLQLVKNAVDHGIEDPLEREARGKHRAGLILIRAEHEGNALFLEVSDDGRGLDTAAIRKAAVDRGLLTADDAGRKDERELFQMIFHPGFSTRDEITEASGRGFGMNVVLETVERLLGRIDVDSRDGQGTRFTMTIPLELGSTSLLLVRMGAHDFAFPLRSIDHVVTATDRNIKLGGPAPELILEEGSATLLDLGMLLKLSQSFCPSPGEQVVVLRGRSGERVAVRVDEIKGDQELVLRPLPRELHGSGAYVGVSTDPRGGLALVIRPEWIFAAAESARSAVAPGESTS